MLSIRLISGVLAGLFFTCASGQHIVPNALLTIDQNRSTVVDRIVSDWGDRLTASNAGISSAQLRDILSGLRADHLLAASLAGSIEGLRDVVSGALMHTDAAISPTLVQTKSLGDTGDDLAYTPIAPCRILDTRNGTTPPYNAPMMGGGAFPIAANLANFAPQGGSGTNCNLPVSFAAIAVTLTVLNPNYDAFLAAGNSNNFATLTKSVVLVFSANKGSASTPIVPVDGTVKFYLGLPAQVTTNVLADAVGYFKRPGNYGGVHLINGINATDSGGFQNSTYGNYATVGGGNQNTAAGDYSTVGGGANNQSLAPFTAISGGAANYASARSSTIAGGESNTAKGFYSIIPGGYGNGTGGDYSFAAGRRAVTAHGTAENPIWDAGAFVWADSNDFEFDSTASNEFSARATGGVRFVLGIDGTGAPTWTCAASNGNSWACSSDQNLKENFQPVDGVSVLQRVSELPLYFWNAKGTDPSVRHMGPTAQDFMAAFALGNSDKMIGMQDADGVALAAIQGLHQMLKQRDREIEALKEKLQTIEAKLGL